MKKKAISGGRRAYILTMRILMGAAAVITAALVLFLIAYVLIKGLPNVSWTLLSTAPSYLSDRIGILPDILNTLYIVIATLLIVLPLGVGAAIYLTEYATNRRLIGAIEYAAETLSGIPSIIYGLGGHAVFLPVSEYENIAAGRRAHARHHEPADHHAHHAGEPQNRAAELPRGRVRPRCGQVACHPHRGAARLRGRRHHRLHPVRRPHPRRVGRAAVHSGLCPRTQRLFEGLSSAGATLTVALYVYAKEQGRFDVAFAIAAILMILTLLINGAATLVERYFRRKRSL